MQDKGSLSGMAWSSKLHTNIKSIKLLGVAFKSRNFIIKTGSGEPREKLYKRRKYIFYLHK